MGKIAVDKKKCFLMFRRQNYSDPMKIIIHFSSLLLCGLLLSSVANAQTKVFSGGSATNNFFSNPGNWQGGVVPADSNINFEAGSTSELDPAIVDPAWTSTAQLTRVFAGIGGGSAHVRVVDGGTLRPSSLEVGRESGDFDTLQGFIRLESGGSIMTAARNAGLLQIGTGLSTGVITVEPDATFEFGRIILGSNGRIEYNFGADSVTPFVNVQNSAANDYQLDGVIAVDLANLVTIGTYTLMESGLSTITGGFANWLNVLPDNEFSGSGDGSFGGGLFEVTSSAGFDSWTLALTNSGKNLEFSVIPEPRTYALFMGLVVLGVIVWRRRVR